MQHIRLDSKEGIASGWSAASAGFADARNIPERYNAAGKIDGNSDDAEASAPKRGWAGAAFRFVRNALIGLTLLTAIPVGVVQLRSHYQIAYDYSVSANRIGRVERFRSLEVAKDPSITPMQAGTAFHALQMRDGKSSVPMREVPLPAPWPWRTNKISGDMFAKAGPLSKNFYGPRPELAIEQARVGYSEAELAWLRAVAEAPVWKDFDMVASAKAVDMIGGQYVLPFPEGINAFQLPIVKFANMKELAYAGVSRAAYYLAIGETAKGEAALRSVVSFGFMMVDNASSTIDALVGAVIVNIGQSAIVQYDVATGTTRQIAEAPVPEVTANPDNRGRRTTAHELQQRLLRGVNDPTLPRSVRMEQLRQLSFSSCTNVPGMLFGPGDEIETAYAKAAKDLARYPSEAAFIELMLEGTNRILVKDNITSAPERLIMGAAAVASTITGNPRFESCTRVAISNW